MFRTVNYVYLMLVAFIFGISYQKANAKCQLQMKELAGEYAPYLVNQERIAYYPIENGKLVLEENYKILGSCVNVTKSNIGHIVKRLSCSQGKVNDFKCAQKNVPVLWTTNTPCFNNGVYRFLDFAPEEWHLPLHIRVCYKYETASPIYTFQVIRGSILKYYSDKKVNIPLNQFGTLESIEENCAYKRHYQFGSFQLQLGSKAAVRKYITPKSFLIPAQLSPGKNFPFKNWQEGAFYYINTAPQWKQINKGNWKILEKIIRKKANRLRGDLRVWTGLFETLSLPNEFNVNVKLYLEPWGKDPLMPIPKWLWKVIIYGNEAIAFLTLNNPFAEKANCPCTNICEDHRWSRTAFSDIQKGFTCCCEIGEFVSATKIYVHYFRSVGLKILSN